MSGGGLLPPAARGLSPRMGDRLCIGMAVGAVICATAIVHAQAAPDWVRQRSLDPRYAHAMVRDEARGRVVLFGGVNGNDVRGDTWEWDGVRWAPRSPLTAPTARSGHAMVWDAARREVVLFGGKGSAGLLADTWTWNGSEWARRGVGSAPLPRAGHGMAWDGVTQRVILFGGTSGAGVHGDTWAWNGAAWTLQTPTVSPSPRTALAMCFDPARGRVVLFGGETGGTVYDETWEWVGASWQRRTPAVSPFTRARAALAYDMARQRVMLFGGSVLPDGRAPFGDTWEWDGVNWMLRSPRTPPGARQGHALAFDDRSGGVIAFGGADAYGRGLADTHRWNGSDWQSVQQTEVLPALDIRLVHVGSMGRTLMVGAPGNGAPLATLVMQGDGWRRIVPPFAPSERRLQALAYDAHRQRVVLFGGHANFAWVDDTWEWNGLAWTQLSPLVRPPAGAGVLVYDGIRRRALWFDSIGGLALTGDIWEWDGANWARRTTQGVPFVRGPYVGTFDSLRQRTVLCGTDANYAITVVVEWDGSRWWAPPTPSPSPPVSFVPGAAMTFDESMSRSVLSIGLVGSANPAENWAWDGVAWSRVPDTSAPRGLTTLATTYDAARQRLVLVGRDSGGVIGTWLLGRAAATSAYGAGCGGGRGTPDLVAGVPHLGNGGFALEVGSAAGDAPCAFALSPTAQNQAIGGGCTLYVDLSASVFLPALCNASGVAHAFLPVPDEPSLRRAPVFAQAIVVDPTGPVSGLTFSAGRRIDVGD